MPKIFLIKNRLHQQQQKLLEAQKQRADSGESFTPPVSPLSSDQPLSLIINKNNDSKFIKDDTIINSNVKSSQLEPLASHNVENGFSAADERESRSNRNYDFTARIRYNLANFAQEGRLSYYGEKNNKENDDSSARGEKEEEAKSEGTRRDRFTILTGNSYYVSQRNKGIATEGIFVNRHASDAANDDSGVETSTNDDDIPDGYEKERASSHLLSTKEENEEEIPTVKHSDDLPKEPESSSLEREMNSLRLPNAKAKKFMFSIKYADLMRRAQLENRGERIHIRTAAEKKEYPAPLVKASNNDDDGARCKEPKPFRCQQVSVIQRTPPVIVPRSEEKNSDKNPKDGNAEGAEINREEEEDEEAKEAELDDEEEECCSMQEPEQEAPIDYHVPKKISVSGSVSDEESQEDRRRVTAVFPQRRYQPVLFFGRKLGGSTGHNGILVAAAGHNRNGNSNNCSNGSHQGNGASSGGSRNSSGHSGYGGGVASMYGNGYGGGCVGGSGSNERNNNNGLGDGGPLHSMPNVNIKCGYDVSASQLPPFYESLKVTNLPCYQQQICSQYQTLISDQIGMDCDTGQDPAAHLGSLFGSGGNGDLLPKQYSLLQNVCASYGLSMKEEDMSYSVSVGKDTNGINGNNNFLNYDETLMIDNDSVDPLQFTATLTFNTPDNSQILENLPEGPSSDLFSREPTENIPPPVEPCVNPFPEHHGGYSEHSPGTQFLINAVQNYAVSSATGHTHKTASYNSNFNEVEKNLKSEPPELPLNCNNHGGVRDEPHVRTQQQLQQLQLHIPQHPNNEVSSNQSALLSPGLSSLELESNTSMSLPSPTNCSLDGTGSLSPSPHAPSTCPVSTAPIDGLPLKVRVGVGALPHRVNNVPPAQPPNYSPFVNKISAKLGIPGDMAIEFVNGGHGIKNPLANQDSVVSISLQKPEVERVPETESHGKPRFICRLCSKTFNLQRLLNRHLKCHSDIKRYLCTFCGKGFNDTFDLKRHTRTHTGVRPYKCNLCEKSFTQRCSLESHCLKVHGVQHQYAYKERRTKMYVCEECGHTTNEPETHYIHLKEKHPYSPALLKFYDKRHFKFTNSNFANMLLQVRS